MESIDSLFKEFEASSGTQGSDAVSARLVTNLLSANQDLYLLAENGRFKLQPSVLDEARNVYDSFSLWLYHKPPEDEEVIKVSSLELIQIAKSYYLRGVVAFILDPTGQGVFLPFPYLLSEFFKRLDIPDAVDDDFCGLIDFFNRLHFNTLNRLGMRSTDGVCTIIEDKNIHADTLTPVSPAALWSITDPQIRIASEAKYLTVDLERFQQVLELIGCPKGEEPYTGYLNVPYNLDFDWHTASVYLKFPAPPTVEKPEPEAPTVEVQDETETPKITDDTEETVPETQDETKDEYLADEQTELSPKDKLGMFFSGVAVTLTGLTAGFKAWFTERKDKPAGEGDAEKPVDPGKERVKHIVSVAAFVVIMACVCFVAISCLRVSGEFKALVENREFSQAHDLYTASRFISKRSADSYLSDTMDHMVAAYSSDKMPYEEASASIAAINALFERVNEKSTQAQLRLQELHDSKASYSEGINADTPYQRLYLWRKVVNLDTDNYQAAKKDVAENETEYLMALNDELNYYSSRSYDLAKDRYDVLTYWYPDSGEADLWKDTFEDSEVTVFTSVPVKISYMGIRQETSGYWTLYIEWTNNSAKTIDEIRFSVMAMTETGDLVISSDKNGEWSIFDALDTDDYAPGEGIPENSYWSKVFKGGQISKAKLTGINIKYTDGSESSVVDPAMLAKITRSAEVKNFVKDEQSA